MKVMARRIDNQDSLDPRTRQLLRALIGRYIRDGQPVGSQTLARHAGLDVSPATISNILSDLEALGQMAAPHTSAGRISTARGLRVFVDSLIEWRSPAERQIQLIHASRAPRTLAAGRARSWLACSDGHQVGSPRRTPHAGLTVSRVTNRNILSGVQELRQRAVPRTAAGRIPTARGRRLFVNSLIEWRSPELRQIQVIHEGLAAQA